MMARKLIVGALIAAPLCLLAWVVIQHLQLKSAFARIEHGTSRAEIIETLGEPRWVGRCGNWGGLPPTGCVRDIGYTSVLGFTDVWVVSLDANDRAVRKLRYRSP
jgi:hypothetical protein